MPSFTSNIQSSQVYVYKKRFRYILRIENDQVTFQEIDRDTQQSVGALQRLSLQEFASGYDRHATETEANSVPISVYADAVIEELRTRRTIS